MFPERDFRVDSAECDMPSVILPGPDGVKPLIIGSHKVLAAVGVFPDPIAESVLDGLLLLLRQRGFLLVHDAALFPGFRVFIRVINAHVPQVQRVLQNLVGVHTGGAVSGIGGNVPSGDAVFVGDFPFGGIFRVFYFNYALLAPRGFQKVVHKILKIFLIHPCGSQTHVNFGSVQILRLRLTQRLNIPAEVNFRVHDGVLLRFPQLFPHVPGQVFVGGQILFFRAGIQGLRIQKNDALQIGEKLVLAFS